MACADSGAMLIAAGLAIGALALVAAWTAVTLRGLRAAARQADAAWSSIDVALRQRLELAERLVAVVGNLTPTEAPVLAVVVEACAHVRVADRPPARAYAERRVTEGLGTLSDLVERHPLLGGDADFVDLQARLAGLEDDIHALKRSYNADVRAYLARRAQFPDALLDRLGDFPERPSFELAHSRERFSLGPSHVA
jgi:LemA protein